MNGDLPDLASFYLTGVKSPGEREGIDCSGLRPALFARNRDLSSLRYDYPLVLTASGEPGQFMISLADAVDRSLCETAPQGAAGEANRQHVLKLEDCLRRRINEGASDKLSALWDAATEDLAGQADADTDTDIGVQIRDSLRRARENLAIDGEVLGCDDAASIKILTHAWTLAEGAKSAAFRNRIDHLALKLSEILRADFLKSAQARGPEALQSSVGKAYETAFDFGALSRILSKDKVLGSLPESRIARIRETLDVLASQRFCGLPEKPGGNGKDDGPYCFLFDDGTAAIEAFRARLPEMKALVKAIAIAELEIQNRYRETTHDAFFQRFDESSLGPEDMELFPSYLVRLSDEKCTPADIAQILDTLASDMPLKVLFETHDVLALAGPDGGARGIGGGAMQLAHAALGLGTAFVLQSASSGLYRSREHIVTGLQRYGPALFSIFSGAVGSMPDVPAYLAAAAAAESRAFPFFVFDPAAGSEWVTRFRLDGNPQLDAAWPIYGLDYEDDGHQRVKQDIAFSVIDFALCDSRYKAEGMPVPRSRWHDNMVAAAEFVDQKAEETKGKIPFVLMVDAENRMHRVVVDEKLIRAARRCAAKWRSLQELGGIHNSHAERLLKSERQSWAEEKERALAEQPGKAAPVTADPVAAAGTEAADSVEQVDEAEAAVPSPDEPYIETSRCTTCDECTALNSRMFAYNDNKQAIIADLDAGTFRDMVMAAENCQVSIIHPGKPRNPDEPNLEDLIARAEPFN